MKVAVYTHPEFERQFKRYRKKYHSLVDDYAAFLKTIKENPLSGVDLGNGVRKVRMGVASKRGGKSGGMRVITYLLRQLDAEILTLHYSICMTKAKLAIFPMISLPTC